MNAKRLYALALLPCACVRARARDLKVHKGGNKEIIRLRRVVLLNQ